MAIVLAIEPDRRQAAHLTSILKHQVGAELVIADTTEGALDAIGNRVPDLVLVPALLSPQDDAALAAALRVIAAAAHVRTLTIPALSSGVKEKASGGMLSKWRKSRSASPEPEGCDPAVFGEQIVTYLKEAAAERAQFEEDELLNSRRIAVSAPAVSAVNEPQHDVPTLVSEPDEAPLRSDYQSWAVEAKPTWEAEPLSAETVPVWRHEPVAADAEGTWRDEPVVADAERTWRDEPVVADTERMWRAEPVAADAERTWRTEPDAVESEPTWRVDAEPVVVETKSAWSMDAEPVRLETEPAWSIDADPVVVDAERVELSATDMAEDPAIEAADESLFDLSGDIEELSGSVATVEVDGEPVGVYTISTDDDADSGVFDAFDLMPGLLDPPNIKELVEAALDHIAAASSMPIEPVPAERRRPTLVRSKAARPEPVSIEAVAARMPTIERTESRRADIKPWVPMYLTSGRMWPALEGVPAETPAPRSEQPDWIELVASLRQDLERRRTEPSSVADPVAVRPSEGAAAPVVTHRLVAKKPRPEAVRKANPVQDEWGFFDPERCGFSTLLAKLEEITDEEARP